MGEENQEEDQQEGDFEEIKEILDDDPTPEELLGDTFIYFEFEANAIQELTDKTIEEKELVEGEEGEVEGPKSLPETGIEEEDDEDEWEIERVIDSEVAADQDYSEEPQVQQQPQLEVTDQQPEELEGQGQEDQGQTDSDMVKAASDIRKLIGGTSEAEDDDRPGLEITSDIRSKLEEMAAAIGGDPQDILDWVVDQVYSTHKLWVVRPLQVDVIDGRIFVEGYNQEFVDLGEPAFFDTAKKLAESIRKQNLIAMLMYVDSGKWTVLYESPRDKMTRVLDAMRVKT